MNFHLSIGFSNHGVENEIRRTQSIGDRHAGIFQFVAGFNQNRSDALGEFRAAGEASDVEGREVLVETPKSVHQEDSEQDGLDATGRFARFKLPPEGAQRVILREGVAQSPRLVDLRVVLSFEVVGAVGLRLLDLLTGHAQQMTQQPLVAAQNELERSQSRRPELLEGESFEDFVASLEEVDGAERRLHGTSVPLLQQPVGRLLAEHVVVTFVSDRRVVVVAQLADVGRLQVSVPATAFASLLNRIPRGPREHRLRRRNQRVKLRHDLRQKLETVRLRLRLLHRFQVNVGQGEDGDLEDAGGGEERKDAELVQRVFDDGRFGSVPVGSELLSDRGVANGDDDRVGDGVGRLVHDADAAGRQRLQRGTEDLAGLAEHAFILARVVHIAGSVQKVRFGDAKVAEYDEPVVDAVQADFLSDVADGEVRVRLQSLRVAHRHQEAVQSLTFPVRRDEVREQQNHRSGFAQIADPALRRLEVGRVDDELLRVVVVRRGGSDTLRVASVRNLGDGNRSYDLQEINF